MRKRFFLLFVLLFVLIAGMASAQTLSKQTQTSNWQKMKDCSAQTDRIAKRYEWREMKKEGDIIRLSWRDHYSPKYDRCFIQVFYQSDMPEKERLETQMPLWYSELYDAFEYNLLAVAAASSPFENFKDSGNCLIDNMGQPCEQCRRFIDERMKN